MSLKRFLEFYKTASRQMEACDPEHWWRVPFDRAVAAACENYPEHRDVCEVFTKVALVNRMYMANLPAEWDVAHAFVDGRADVVMAPLRALAAFNAETMAVVVECHAALVALARRATGRNEESFCSKYASFHFQGIVPILDRHAENYAWSLTQEILVADNRKGRYELHCERVLHISDFLRSEGVRKPNIKLMDHVLYSTRDQ